MLDFLAGYVQTHFEHEEQLMQKHGCRAKDANQRAHKQFLQDFSKLKSEFESKGESLAVLIVLKQLVADWLTNHILREDMAYRPYLKG